MKKYIQIAGILFSEMALKYKKFEIELLVFFCIHIIFKKIQHDI
jgi:hypothetical protein